MKVPRSSRLNSYLRHDPRNDLLRINQTRMMMKGQFQRERSERELAGRRLRIPSVVLQKRYCMEKEIDIPVSRISLEVKRTVSQQTAWAFYEMCTMIYKDGNLESVPTDLSSCALMQAVAALHMNYLSGSDHRVPWRQLLTSTAPRHGYYDLLALQLYWRAAKHCVSFWQVMEWMQKEVTRVCDGLKATEYDSALVPCARSRWNEKSLKLCFLQGSDTFAQKGQCLVPFKDLELVEHTIGVEVPFDENMLEKEPEFPPVFVYFKPWYKVVDLTLSKNFRIMLTADGRYVKFRLNLNSIPEAKKILLWFPSLTTLFGILAVKTLSYSAKTFYSLCIWCSGSNGWTDRWVSIQI